MAKTYYLRPNFKKIRPGFIVVHNHVAHTKNQMVGLHGFRAWQQEPAKDRVRCRCGWLGIEHYRVRGQPANVYSLPAGPARPMRFTKDFSKR